MIPKSIKLQFYKSLLDSNASEHGARMTAMDNATENAGELLKKEGFKDLLILRGGVNEWKLQNLPLI